MTAPLGHSAENFCRANGYDDVEWGMMTLPDPSIDPEDQNTWDEWIGMYRAWPASPNPMKRAAIVWLCMDHSPFTDYDTLAYLYRMELTSPGSAIRAYGVRP